MKSTIAFLHHIKIMNSPPFPSVAAFISPSSDFTISSLNENPKPVPCNKKCPNAIRNFTDRQHEVALSDLLRKSWL